MNHLTRFSIFAGATLLLASCASLKPGEISKEQADSVIAVRRSEISALQSQVSSAQAAATKTTSDAQQRMADADKCRDALYAMLGSDRNGYNAYREQLARDEQELAALKQMSPSQQAEAKARIDALEAQIRMLRGNKLVLIPDHMRRVQTLSSNF